MIYYATLFNLPDGTHRIKTNAKGYDSFLGAIEEEMLQTSTPQEIEDCVRVIISDMWGEDLGVDPDYACFCLLTASKLVMRSVLETYAKEKTFGILVDFNVQCKEFRIICAPTETWIDIICQYSKLQVV